MKNIKTRILEKLSIKKSIIPAICLVSFLSTGFVAAEKAAPVITLNSEEAVIIDYNSTFDRYSKRRYISSKYGSY